MDTLILYIYFLIIKINIFRGDVRDISSETAKLAVTLHTSFKVTMLSEYILRFWATNRNCVSWSPLVRGRFEGWQSIQLKLCFYFYIIFLYIFYIKLKLYTLLPRSASGPTLHSKCCTSTLQSLTSLSNITNEKSEDKKEERRPRRDAHKISSQNLCTTQKHIRAVGMVRT